MRASGATPESPPSRPEPAMSEAIRVPCPPTGRAQVPVEEPGHVGALGDPALELLHRGRAPGCRAAPRSPRRPWSTRQACSTLSASNTHRCSSRMSAAAAAAALTARRARSRQPRRTPSAARRPPRPARRRSGHRLPQHTFPWVQRGTSGGSAERAGDLAADRLGHRPQLAVQDLLRRHRLPGAAVGVPGGGEDDVRPGADPAGALPLGGAEPLGHRAGERHRAHPDPVVDRELRRRRDPGLLVAQHGDADGDGVGGGLVDVGGAQQGAAAVLRPAPRRPGRRARRGSSPRGRCRPGGRLLDAAEARCTPPRRGRPWWPARCASGAPRPAGRTRRARRR